MMKSYWMFFTVLCEKVERDLRSKAKYPIITSPTGLTVTRLRLSRYLMMNVSGSPADKADLEVADEILEINGKPLHNSSHTEVINHIHNVS